MIVTAILPVFGQVAINTDGSNPDASAIVDIKSNNRGFLPPRISKGKRDSIPHPAEGLTVYDTTLNSLDFYNGEKWISISKGGIFPNDTNVFQLAIGSSKADGAKAIICTPDGGFLVGGYTKYSSQNDSSNMLLVKLTADGTFDHYGVPFGIYYQGNDETIHSLYNLSGTGYLLATTDEDVNTQQRINAYWFTPNRLTDIKYGLQYSPGDIIMHGFDKQEVFSAIQTSDDKFLFAGNADTVNNENYPDAIVIKTDSVGNIINNSASYVSGPYYDRFNQIIETTDGHYLSVGYTYGTNNSSSTMLIVKFNSDLTIDTHFGTNGIVIFGTGNGYTFGKSVVQTDDGGFLIAGETSAFGAGGGYDACFVKLQPNGDLDKNFGTNGVLTVGGSNNENIWKIIKTKDGNYVATGYEYIYFYGIFNGDMYLLKISPSGQLVQGFGYNGSGAVAIGSSYDDCANDVVETPGGYLVLAGYTYGFGAGSSDMYVVKVSPSGHCCSNAKAAGITTGSGGSVLTPTLYTGDISFYESAGGGTYNLPTGINISPICH